MTRITNFGRKRTHVEATFNYNEADLEDSDADSSLENAAGESTAVTPNAEGVEPTETPEDDRGVDDQPPKKKRKRGPRRKAGAKTAATAEGDEGGKKVEVDGAEGEVSGNKSKSASGKKAKHNKSRLSNLQGSPPHIFLTLELT
jgi:zinc finger CCHC domain-containing protein 9